MVPTGGWTCTFTDTGGTDTGITIAAGTYYLNSSSGSLLSTLQTALNASGTLAGTYTVAIADTGVNATGYITISATGTAQFTADLGADFQALEDLLGFAGPLVPPGTTFTGTEQPQKLWLPNVGRSNPMSPEPSASGTNIGALETDYFFTLAPSGESTRMVYNTRYMDNFEFRYLKASKTWTSQESVTNESFQTFYSDVIAEGLPMRYYSDRTDNSVHWDWVVENGGQFAPEPVQPGWVGSNSLWGFSYRVRKSV